ncbi:MAG: site-specific DNA-methyltransferase, partial [Candidatus Methanofastidiosa archaeon]|nr:site-specific DNA-methyltransferase [Candidatus Methanofastidiosa archaeon]
MQSQNLVKKELFKEVDPSWDFRGSDTKYSNHSFHTYPAMMIPQIARRLIETYGKDAKVLLDPFMGSGTAVLEATLHNNFTKAYGIDINPLAILISKVKTTPINSDILSNEYKKLIDKCVQGLNEINLSDAEIETPNFFNIDFWFKPKVIRELTIIKNNIEIIKDPKIKNFFYVVFSETVRNVSNTRNSEFKLYRMNDEKLKIHNPNVLGTFKDRAQNNIRKMESYETEANKKCQVKILSEDSRYKTSIKDKEVDLIVTSPPYVDSR